jgi:purine-binding chemotaxis protein CheW
MASRQFATFEVADQLFGVEVHTVQEVLSYNEYTPVPLAPPAVGGLFNLRGQVIAAVDLRVQLGLVRQAMQGPVMNVILRGDGEPVSLLVDRATGMCTLAATYESREALQATNQDVATLREQFTRETGFQVTDMAEMELALAQLHVPETV